TASLVINRNTATMTGAEFRCVLTNSSGGFNCTQPAVLTVLASGVSTLAGEAGVSGNTDGIGTTAQFNSPNGLVVDSDGSVWVADSGNALIRKITASGEVTTFVGAVATPDSADEAGSNSMFHSPVALAADRGGNLYVVDQGNCAVFQITPAGEIKTLAGM